MGSYKSIFPEIHCYYCWVGRLPLFPAHMATNWLNTGKGHHS
jgi:hypothetical protein